MATYKKRPDGRYASSVLLGYYPDGRPHKMTVYGRTIRELEAKLQSARADLENGLNLADKNTLFGKYASQWLEVSKANRSIQTRHMYESALRLHTDLIRDLPLSKITSQHIQAQINTLASHPRTAQQVKLTISQVFSSALRDRILTFNPCDGIELPRMIKKPRRAFCGVEREAIKSAEYIEEERAFIMLLYGCGLRPAEAYALTWSDVDFKTKTITICKSLNFDKELPVVMPPKTQDGIRRMEAPQFVFKALKEYKRRNHALLLFGAENGSYRHHSEYVTLYRHCATKISHALGRPFTQTAYAFRHNYCTQLYYSGVSIKEAVRLMGHSDSTMIMRVYAHLDSEKENTKKKLNAINF